MTPENDSTAPTLSVLSTLLDAAEYALAEAEGRWDGEDAAREAEADRRQALVALADGDVPEALRRAESAAERESACGDAVVYGPCVRALRLVIDALNEHRTELLAAVRARGTEAGIEHAQTVYDERGVEGLRAAEWAEGPVNADCATFHEIPHVEELREAYYESYDEAAQEESRRLLCTDVAVVAERLGVSPDDECTPDGIDWGYTGGPAEGAPVFLIDGWTADDGNCAVECPLAESGREAAEEYVADGSWGDNASTAWVTVHVWQVCVSVDEDGREIRGRYAEGSHIIAIEPDEPPCAEGEDHDWQSPYEILGGDRHNPGVWAHGGGVVIHEVCMRCGCGRTTDTWAQDPEDGTQGLTSVSYERGKYADEIPSREERELEHLGCAELRRGAAHVLATVRELFGIDACGPDCDVPERAIEVGEYVTRVYRAVEDGHERRAMRLALWLAARNQREAHAARCVGELANLG